MTMAISGQVIGMILGLGIAQARMSKHRLPRYLASAYIWAIRGTPLLVQIVFIYTGLAAVNIIRFEDITVGGFTFAGNVQAAILALGLTTAPGSVADTLVEAVGVEKWFGNSKVLDNVDFTVQRGEVVVLIGPSGSRKTTLLRCINHLEKIERGRITVNGVLIGYRERNGALVEDRESNPA